MGMRSRGDNDPGSESLNLEALGAPGENLFTNFFLAGNCDWPPAELVLEAILFCLAIFKASMRFLSSSS